MEEKCSICKTAVDEETAAILAIGAAGNPRFLCENCEHDFDALVNGTESEAVRAAMDRVGKNMLSSEIDDKVTLRTVHEIMESAKERVRLIESGEYESEAECQEEIADEIPEEYRETEEDRELDRVDYEKNKLYDKITNWVCLALGAVAVVILIIQAIKMIG